MKDKTIYALKVAEVTLCHFLLRKISSGLMEVCVGFVSVSREQIRIAQ